MEVDAWQGKMLLLENRGDGGQASATDSFRPDLETVSSREVVLVVLEKRVTTEPPRWKTGML